MIERLDANLFPAHVTLSEAKGLPGWWLADSSSASGTPQNDSSRGGGTGGNKHDGRFV